MNLKIYAFLFLFYPMLVYSNAELPDLSDEAYINFPIEKETKLGDIFHKRLYSDNYIYKDYLVKDYLQHLGEILVQNSPNQGFKFNFIPINDKNINAFAFFGGNVGVNIGLIDVVDSEGELASVLAHEIAHITQRHLPRIIYENKKRLPLTVLEVLMAAAVGIVFPDVGIYGVQAVLSGHQTAMIGYQRGHEEAADRLGLQILNKTGFDPASMLTMFKKIDDLSRLANKPPLYLSTHPMYETRMADVSDRIKLLSYRQRVDSLWFKLIKERVSVNLLNKLDAIEIYKKRLKSQRYQSKSVTEYGYFISLFKNYKYEEAEKIIKQLINDHPNMLVFKLSYIELLLETSKMDIAYSKISELKLTHYNYISVVSLYNKVLLEMKRYELVEKETKASILVFKNELDLHKDLIKALIGQKKYFEAYIARAELFKLQGKFVKALEQLDFAVALNNADLNKREVNNMRSSIFKQKELYKELGV